MSSKRKNKNNGSQESVKPEEVKEEVKIEPLLKPRVKSGYRVASGKAITCKRGILADGDEIKAEYLSGEGTLERLLKSGLVVEWD